MTLPHNERSAPPDPESERVPRAVMLQSWIDLTFIHWRYPLEVVRPLVPRELELEPFDGSAWVGVIPFEIRNLGPPGLTKLPWLSHFPETNCRTYVRAPDGSRGVWFFSLDAARLAAVVGARVAYGLPYFWAHMRVERKGDRVDYRSSRWIGQGRTKISVEAGTSIDAGSLDRFLTARFRLFSYRFGRLTYSSVEHPTWPLQEGRLIHVEQGLTACAGLPEPEGTPIVHFTRGVTVRVAAPRPVRCGRLGPFQVSFDGCEAPQRPNSVQGRVILEGGL